MMRINYFKFDSRQASVYLQFAIIQIYFKYAGFIVAEIKKYTTQLSFNIYYKEKELLTLDKS